MQCDICRRSPSERLPFHCTICARNVVYEARIRIAQMLLQNEAAGAAVERQTGTRNSGAGHNKYPSDTQSRETSMAWTIQRAYADQASSTEKTEHILTHMKALQNQTATMRTEIAHRKARIAQRRADLQTAQDELAVREATALEPVEKGVRRMEHRWDAMHAKTLESRVFLCREVAQLYGLQRRKTKKEMVRGDAYSIGGMPIADLRDLDSKGTYSDALAKHSHCSRRLSSTGHHVHHAPRPSGSPGLPLSFHSAPGRDYPFSPRLPSTHHFLSGGLVYAS